MLVRVEREFTARALAAYPDDPAAAARLLGVTKAALQQKAKEL
jgi:hypothetical protein